MDKPQGYDAEEVKYYAVRAGIQPGVYMTWAECKANVFKVPGAVFKAFPTLEEAQAYIDAPSTATTLEDISGGGPIAYVDGSYKKSPAQYGYGGFLKANGQTHILQGTGNNPKLLELWNIAGELYGATMAIRKAQELSLQELTLVYDYAGVEKWATGEWDRKSYIAQWYYSFYQAAALTLKVTFIHVDGHTGVEGNELADILAKEAVGAKLRKKDIATIADFRAGAGIV